MTAQGFHRPRPTQPDSFPADATKVLSALARQVAGWHDSFRTAATGSEFVINVAPVTGPDIHPASSRNAFEQVLRGILGFNNSGGKEVDVYRVAVLDVTRHAKVGTVSTHSLVLTPLPSRMYRGAMSIDGYQAHVFVRVATSGYGGSGPAFYAVMNELIEALGPAVSRASLDVEVDPLRRLFLRYGPTFLIRWPDMIFPPSRSWNGQGDDPMEDAYAEWETD